MKGDDTLRDIRAGKEPVWSQRSPKHHGSLFWMGKFVSPIVRCSRHLPEEAKTALEGSKAIYKDPEWWPPQDFFDGTNTWSDNVVTEIYTFYRGEAILHKDTRPCGICAFQEGIEKVRRAIWSRKVFQALEERWITPRPDGYCAYAAWSWRKMQEELNAR